MHCVRGWLWSQSDLNGLTHSTSMCVYCRCIGFRFKVLQTLDVFVCSNSGVCSFFPTEVCHKCIHLRERKRDDIEIQLTEKKETKRQIYQHQQDPLYVCVCVHNETRRKSFNLFIYSVHAYMVYCALESCCVSISVSISISNMQMIIWSHITMVLCVHFALDLFGGFRLQNAFASNKTISNSQLFIVLYWLLHNPKTNNNSNNNNNDMKSMHEG